MSFNVALSGLRAANQDLNVTGNNIANASTVGFKQSRAEFADVYANSVLGTGSRTPGSGVLVSNIAQQFGQGNISITSNSLDLAISGQGFFVLNDRGSPSYTRAGIFGLDRDGYVVGGNNARLQGYRANETGTQIVSGAPTDLRIHTSDIAPQATTGVNLTVNLDSDSSVKGWGPMRGGGVPGQLNFATIPGTAGSLVGGVDIADVGGVTLDATNNQFRVAGPGVTGTVDVTVDPGTYANAADLAVAINNALGAAGAGTNIRAVENASGVVEFQEFDGTTGTQITLADGTANNGLAVIFGTPTVSTNAAAPNTSANSTFTVQIGSGEPQTVVLDAAYADATAMAAAIQSQLRGASVGVEAGALAITPTGSSGGEVVTLGGAAANTLFGAPADRGQERLTFDPSNPNNYNWSTAATIFDSLGNPHVLTTYYVKSGQDSAGTTWDVYATLDGALPPPANPGDPARGPVGSLTFNTSGGLNAAAPLSLNGLWPAPDGADALNFNVNYASSTQFGSDFSVNALTQDGYAPGRLSGVNIDDTGVVFARYTNGQALMLGQVALANFANPQGLSPIGNTQWAESYDSGQPVIGAPQTASLGSIQSGALEDSNVDLSDQLVNLIIAQRNYQANAKTIETANAVTQSIINLR